MRGGGATAAPRDEFQKREKERPRDRETEGKRERDQERDFGDHMQD